MEKFEHNIQTYRTEEGIEHFYYGPLKKCSIGIPDEPILQKVGSDNEDIMRMNKGIIRIDVMILGEN